MIVDVRTDGEVITDAPGRRLVILHSSPALTLTHTRHAAGQEGTAPHVHREHADAFHVLEGQLTLPLGPAGKPLVLTAGQFASVPAGVVHCFVNASGAEAAWLNLHAPDGGFADFLRHGVAWDSSDPPHGGGADPSLATVEPDGAAALAALGVRVLDPEHVALTHMPI